MKAHILFLLSLIISVGLMAQNQTDHLELIYDFEAEDFDYSVIGMLGTNDSLYVISQTPNGQGQLFRIDENGDGFDIIWEFDATTYAPSSIVGNDTIIYGTTRFSENNGGSVFKYSLLDYSFEFIKDFSPEEAQEVRIKYVTDSVLWLSSQWSFVDQGSISTLEKDGSNFTKIYNDTNFEKGQNPIDFVFHNDSIYIACYNGGGVPYPDGTGSTVASGSFIRIKKDGTGYQNIVKGGDDKGTQPQSVVIREGKLIGQFAYSGSSAVTGGQFFRSSLNGTEYDSLGGLKGRALTSMLSTDSLIFGISSSEIFGVSPFTGEIRIFDDIQSNADFGYDVVSNPAYLNGYTFFSAQQGGPDGGGTILRWTNEDPIVTENTGRITKTYSTNIDLNNLFSDPEGDKLSFQLDYDTEKVSIVNTNDLIEITPLVQEVVKIKITAYDGWAGYTETELDLDFSGETNVLGIKDDLISLFPNPAGDFINIDQEKSKNIQIQTLNGKVIKKLKTVNGKIDVSMLDSGVYILSFELDGDRLNQKFIKE